MHRLKVGIDARVMGLRMGGGDTYLRNLVRILPQVASDIDYTLFLTPEQRAISLSGMNNMRRMVVPPTTLQIRIPLTLPLASAFAGVDVLHAHFLAPPLCPVPTVITMHDISYERYPQLFTRGYVLQYRAIMPLIVRRVASIVTVSEFCRRDIIGRYRVAPEKVVVAPDAVDPIFRPLQDQARLAAVRAAYGTGDRFLLCVGEIQPRKNIKTLIEAYVRLRRSGAITQKLVIVGKKAWLYDETFAAARTSGYGSDLVFTGYVPGDDLVALYNAADLFVYPSLFEGFGLPPLEAMACGTPVITSNTSALPEVAGDAAMLIDPDDVEELARAIAALTTNEYLRSVHRQRGFQQVKRYSWETTARTVADLYRRVSRLRA